MHEGGQPGNQNARKAVVKTADEMREYHRLAMQKRRALLRGDITKAYQFVGRPRKKIVKGDIFDVAAKLQKALFATRPHWKPFYDDEPWVQEVDAALQAYRDFWEND